MTATTLRFPLLAALLALWLAATAWAEVPVPALAARVTDLTGTLDAGQRVALESQLQDIEAHDGSQVAVLLVPTTQPEAIEQYALRVAEAWKLGRKGVDNGVLLLVAKHDRKVRIKVGYGLEGDIPDAVARWVIDETIAPRFKQGDFAGGITAGVRRLAGLIAGRAAAEKPALQVPAPSEPGTVPLPSLAWPVMDLTGTLSDEQGMALSKRLNDFYDSGRTKPVFVLVVPSTQPEAIAQYAARILKQWGEADNLDVDRSLLLVIAKDEGKAFIAAGDGLSQRILPGAVERAVSQIIEPQLRRGELAGAVQASVEELEKIVDGAIGNKPLGERLSDNVRELPLWLVVVLVALGTGLRRLLGPLFGGLVTGGLVGGGAWFVSELVGIGIAAGAVAFIFVLVGLANWIGMGLDGVVGGSSGGGSSSGFSGRGGGFGGGGASGNW